MIFIGKTGNRVKEERLYLCWTLGKSGSHSKGSGGKDNGLGSRKVSGDFALGA